MAAEAEALPSLPLARRSPLEPPEELARLRTEVPASRVRATSGEPAWLVTRCEDARTAAVPPTSQPASASVPSCRMELRVVPGALAARPPGLCLAVEPGELAWGRSELFGDQWPRTVPVTW
ncbi:MAG: hypothetical protein ACRDYD_12840 [Acidimicrobiales bacterium]